MHRMNEENQTSRRKIEISLEPAAAFHSNANAYMNFGWSSSAYHRLRTRWSHQESPTTTIKNSMTHTKWIWHQIITHRKQKKKPKLIYIFFFNSSFQITAYRSMRKATTTTTTHDMKLSFCMFFAHWLQTTNVEFCFSFIVLHVARVYVTR